MTTWYLIIILFAPGSGASTSQQTVEFADQAQCEIVRDEIREKIKESWLRSYIECRADR